ncbi:MAG TPA: GTP-binding protein, partial [Aquificae bacterium]|nr:GTP-binding protein [Aquificota bacterium]
MRLPVISIVGRPNVGKSSLFNRLISKRAAIVDNAPGVTRDRIIKEADILDHKVLLVDTGGIDTKATKDEIAKKVKDQALKAIDESDLILFVVDGKTGLTDLDKEVAKILRKKGADKVILLVNKIDEPFMEDLVYEFYKLGFKEVIPVSTIHNLGIETFKEKILEKLPQNSKEYAHRAYLDEEK